LHIPYFLRNAVEVFRAEVIGKVGTSPVTEAAACSVMEIWEKRAVGVLFLFKSINLFQYLNLKLWYVLAHQVDLQ